MKLEGMLGVYTPVRLKNELSVRFAQYSQDWELFCEYPGTELQLLSDTLKMADFILVKHKLNRAEIPKHILGGYCLWCPEIMAGAFIITQVEQNTELVKKL